MPTLIICNFRAFAIVAFSLLITACGGGAGDGGSSPGFSLSSNKVIFSGNSDSISGSQTQTVNVRASGGTIYFKIDGYSNATLSCPGGSSCTITISSGSFTNTMPGTYTSTLNVHACRDIFCQSDIDGSPQQITITKNIYAGLSISPISLSLNGIEGSSSLSQALDLNYSGSPTSWSANVSYQDGDSWLNLDKTSGSTFPDSILLTGAALSAGIYRASINLTYIGGSSTVIPVTYTVSSLLGSSAPQWDITVNGITTSNILSNIINISSNDSMGEIYDWSAISDQSWLAVSTPNGDTDTQNQLIVTIVESELASLPNQTYHGNLTLSSSVNGVSDLVIPVVLNVDFPQVKYVMPYIAAENTGGKVLLNGTGFSGITSDVNFGVTASLSVTAINNQLMHAEHDGLTAGDYPVSISNSLGIGRVGANLKVITEPNYLQQSVATSGYTYTMVYDAERSNIYIANNTNDQIERLHFNGSNWETDNLSITDLRYITMSPDGKSLIAFTTWSSVSHVDLDTFIITDTLVSQIDQIGAMNEVQMTNTGDVLVFAGQAPSILSAYIYSVEDMTFTQIGTGFSNVRTGISGDGNRVIITSSNGPVQYYDVNTGVISNSTLQVSQDSVVVNRDASRWVYSFDTVYDDSFTQLGRLPVNIIALTISQDGTRAYGYTPGGGLPFVPARIHTYDLTQTDTNGVFIEIGTGIDVSNNLGYLHKMNLSLAEDVIFLRGSEGMIVQPLP